MKIFYQAIVTIIVSACISYFVAVAAIKQNPEVIISSVQEYQVSQMKQESTKAQDNIVKNLDRIIADPKDPFVGKANFKKVVVEFFDYNCGYCKKTFPEINKLLEADPEIKFVFKELPIFGPNSELPAKAALAVHKNEPDKYFAFHGKLMEFTGEKTIENLSKIAKEIGVKFDISEEVKKPEYEIELQRVNKLAQDLGLNGTPAFVVNGKLIPGAASAADILEKFNEK